LSASNGDPTRRFSASNPDCVASSGGMDHGGEDLKIF
jgi:hypothetical protein